MVDYFSEEMGTQLYYFNVKDDERVPSTLQLSEVTMMLEKLRRRVVSEKIELESSDYNSETVFTYKFNEDDKLCLEMMNDFMFERMRDNFFLQHSNIRLWNDKYVSFRYFIDYFIPTFTSKKDRESHNEVVYGGSDFSFILRMIDVGKDFLEELVNYKYHCLNMNVQKYGDVNDDWETELDKCTMILRGIYKVVNNDIVLFRMNELYIDKNDKIKRWKREEVV